LYKQSTVHLMLQYSCIARAHAVRHLQINKISRLRMRSATWNRFLNETKFVGWFNIVAFVETSYLCIKTFWKYQ